MIARRSLLMATMLAPAAVWARPRLPAFDIRAIERRRLLPHGDALLAAQPRTIAAIPAPRSPAGRHDYYSEGDYWWPDPANHGGPYVRRDGRSNPDKFDGHRDALIAFGRTVPALAALWDLTGERRFADAAMRHLSAWFVDPRDADARQPRPRAGDHRRQQRPRDRRHRHAADRRGRARRGAVRAPERAGLCRDPRGRGRLVRRLSGLAHDIALRHHRARRKE